MEEEQGEVTFGRSRGRQTRAGGKEEEQSGGGRGSGAALKEEEGKRRQDQATRDRHIYI